MALRVLLADESSTIKKVMQLALQDFGVEVKAVPIGLDVIQVARSFNPDIVFADILLAKRNGYEVSADLKADAGLRKVPVVLMWSSFMELDETKAKSAKAEGRLEKPFDADTLRDLVRKLVPQTSDNVIANYLSFPELPPMVEDEKPSPADAGNEIELVDLNQDLGQELDEPEEFQQVSLKQAGKQASKHDDWTHQDLSKFKIEIPQEDFNLDVDEADLTRTSIALSSGAEEISLDEIDSPNPTPTNKKPTSPFSSTFSQSEFAAPQASGGKSNLGGVGGVSAGRAEEILREEVRAVIENIAWKVIPDLAERIVREEIQKLLKDAERI